jgi:copper resistance protein C
MRRTIFARFGATLVSISLLLLALPGVAVAHAELVSSFPKDGAKVTSPTEISAVYSEAMTSDGSSLKVVDASGKVVASGGVVDVDDTRMEVTPQPDLSVGTYTVQSTTVSKADGDLDRTTWTFTVTAVAPTPVCTDGCGPNGTNPTALPTPSSTTFASPSASATVAPSPSAGGDSDPNASASDALLPIVAAVAILVVAAIWFSRRGRRSPGA